MDKQTLKRILDEAILKGTNEKMDALWDQVEKVTIGMEDIKETLDSHTTQQKS